jgi:hypothetical protein
MNFSFQKILLGTLPDLIIFYLFLKKNFLSIGSCLFAMYVAVKDWIWYYFFGGVRLCGLTKTVLVAIDFVFKMSFFYKVLIFQYFLFLN